MATIEWQGPPNPYNRFQRMIAAGYNPPPSSPLAWQPPPQQQPPQAWQTPPTSNYPGPLFRGDIPVTVERPNHMNVGGGEAYDLPRGAAAGKWYWRFAQKPPQPQVWRDPRTGEWHYPRGIWPPVPLANRSWQGNGGSGPTYPAVAMPRGQGRGVVLSRWNRGTQSIYWVRDRQWRWVPVYYGPRGQYSTW